MSPTLNRRGFTNVILYLGRATATIYFMLGKVLIARWFKSLFNLNTCWCMGLWFIFLLWKWEVWTWTSYCIMHLLRFTLLSRNGLMSTWLQLVKLLFLLLTHKLILNCFFLLLLTLKFILSLLHLALSCCKLFLLYFTLVIVSFWLLTDHLLLKSKLVLKFLNLLELLLKTCLGFLSNIHQVANTYTQLCVDCTNMHSRLL